MNIFYYNEITMYYSSVQMICVYISCYLGLPFISVIQQFFFVVQQLLVSFRRIFKIRRFDNCIYWARFLAISAEDALRHVYVVAYGSSGSVRSCFRLYGDGLSWTSRFAEFAGYASFFSGWVAS